MKIASLILYALLITAAWASDSSRVTISSDLNNDGKIDFKEIFEDKILIERKEDLNADGIFDRQTLFEAEASEEYFKIINESKYGDIPRKRVSF